MPKIRKFVGVVKAGQLSHTYIHTDIQTYRGYLIGPSPTAGPKGKEDMKRKEEDEKEERRNEERKTKKDQKSQG